MVNKTGYLGQLKKKKLEEEWIYFFLCLQQDRNCLKILFSMEFGNACRSCDCSYMLYVITLMRLTQKVLASDEIKIKDKIDHKPAIVYGIGA
jgi:hypothetical protein